MPPNDAAAAAYVQRLALAASLFAAGQYEAAYHSLMPVLHRAGDAGGAGRRGHFKTIRAAGVRTLPQNAS
jgi:hypothetical protein